MPVRIAMLQMKVVGGDRSANLARAARLVAEAADEGAQLVILPEVMDLGWTHPFGSGDVGVIPDGDTCWELRHIARRSVVYLCAGLLEREGDHIYNSAVLIDPSGHIILKHRKINELEIAHDMYAVGDRLGVVDTPLGRIGLIICADGFAHGQVLTRSLGYMGAQVVLAPSAWAVPADWDNNATPYGDLWRDSFAPPASDFEMWIAGVSNVGEMTAGPWAGRHCIGASMLIGPDGHSVMQGRFGVDAESILFAEIEPVPRTVRGTQWARRVEAGRDLTAGTNSTLMR